MPSNADFRTPVGRPTKTPGPETIAWFWNPRFYGVKFAPEDFREKLHRIDPELEVTWNGHLERWMVWAKSSRVNNEFCQGWNLLFIHNGRKGEFLPLDERVFARIYMASVHEHGSAKAYWGRIETEMKRDKARADAARRQDNADRSGEVWDHAQIRVGYGANNGSKFSKYHA